MDFKIHRLFHVKFLDLNSEYTSELEKDISTTKIMC